MGINDVELLQEVKVTHIDHVAVHLAEADISDFAQCIYQGQSFLDLRTIQELLEELVGAHCMEHLVIAVLPQVEVLIEIDAPIARMQ